LDVRMYGISPPLWAFLGAGDETRTRDSLLGRRFALYAVAEWSIFAYSRGFLLLPVERKLSSYGVVNGGSWTVCYAVSGLRPVRAGERLPAPPRLALGGPFCLNGPLEVDRVHADAEGPGQRPELNRSRHMLPAFPVVNRHRRDAELVAELKLRPATSLT
jgi:hypothetical protein